MMLGHVPSLRPGLITASGGWNGGERKRGSHGMMDPVPLGAIGAVLGAVGSGMANEAGKQAWESAGGLVRRIAGGEVKAPTAPANWRMRPGWCTSAYSGTPNWRRRGRSSPPLYELPAPDRDRTTPACPPPRTSSPTAKGAGGPGQGGDAGVGCRPTLWLRPRVVHRAASSPTGTRIQPAPATSSSASRHPLV